MSAALIAAGGAALLGAGASAYGQHTANKTNLKIAREQMKFQEEMSSTSYQRAMQDMRQSGLNPMLAFQQGGASSPGGASARMENVGAAAVGGGTSAASTSMAVQATKKQMKLLTEQTREQSAKSDYQEAYTKAHGITRTKEGGIRLDLSTPGILDKVEAEINSARSRAALEALAIPERDAIAKLWSTIGGGGKGAQVLIPLLLSMARGR